MKVQLLGLQGVLEGAECVPEPQTMRGHSAGQGSSCLKDAPTEGGRGKDTPPGAGESGLRGLGAHRAGTWLLGEDGQARGVGLGVWVGTVGGPPNQAQAGLTGWEVGPAGALVPQPRPVCLLQDRRREGASGFLAAGPGSARRPQDRAWPASAVQVRQGLVAPARPGGSPWLTARPDPRLRGRLPPCPGAEGRDGSRVSRQPPVQLPTSILQGSCGDMGTRTSLPGCGHREEGSEAGGERGRRE